MDADVFVPCDTCGMRSYVFIKLKSGRELTMCGHHGAENMDALVMAGANIVDLRHLIGYA